MRLQAPLTELLPPGASGNVLVVKPSSLGDIAHTLPAVAWLHQAWPELRIHWLANTEWLPLLQGSPLLAGVVEFPRRQFGGWAGWRRARLWMRDYQTAMAGLGMRLALDFQGLLRSAWLARKSGASTILGLDDAREGARFFYQAAVPADPTGDGVPHSVDRYLALVRALGPAIDETSALAGDWLPPGEPVAGLPSEPFVVLHPFARGTAKALDWQAVRRLCDAWHDLPVVLVGQSTDAPHAPHASLPRNVVNQVNATTLLQLIGILRRAAWVVSVDSGPMHLASALHRPLVAIHTWSDPRSVGPYDAAAWIWKGGRLVHRPEIDPGLAARHDVPSFADLDEIAALVRRGFPALRERS